ncbi:MAG: class I SAM-dependent methyltransferase [Actinomycetota bacterium]
MRSKITTLGGNGAEDVKRANVVYHDYEARNYDDKWSISFDERCITYAAQKFEKVIPRGRVFEQALEVGCGTGFFLLNLCQAGFIKKGEVCDISPGMVEVCLRNAGSLGLEIEGRPADVENLPYEEGSFDLVVGHAFLHHLPDPKKALAEIHRVLAPGGMIVVAGEPTRWGHRIASVARKSAVAGFKAFSLTSAGRKLRQDPRPGDDSPDAEAKALESEVDLWTFDPDEVALWAKRAGFRNVRVETEELLSSLLGWSVRTIEGMAKPGSLPGWWPFWAYNNYLKLYSLDDRWLYRFMPRQLFYNLILAGEKAAAPAGTTGKTTGNKAAAPRTPRGAKSKE